MIMLKMPAQNAKTFFQLTPSLPSASIAGGSMTNDMTVVKITEPARETKLMILLAVISIKWNKIYVNILVPTIQLQMIRVAFEDDTCGGVFDPKSNISGQLDREPVRITEPE